MLDDATESPAVSVRNLWSRFGESGRWVHRGIDLEVARGEGVAVVGGSGAGKSSLFRVLLGLHRPDLGEVCIDGVDVLRAGQADLYRLMRRIGVLFQFGALFDSLSVWENVTFALADRGLSREELRQIAGEKLKMVGLRRVEDRRPGELSGGMRKRVALARAIAAEPRFLFCDEPTSGLDPVLSDVISELIVQMKERLHVTTITITHDLKSANKIADRIAMLHEGRILALEPPAALRANPNPVVQQFVQGRAVGPMSIGDEPGSQEEAPS
jgi:phospholipid/cholesterol/gamma-HCH transport system ATP-binding protein